MTGYDIIGDIHGCLNEFLEMLFKLKYTLKNGVYSHSQNRKLVSLGDLNDRGPDSLKVIEIIINMSNSGNALYVYGNHCNKFYRYLKGNKVKVMHGLETTANEYNSLTENEKELFKAKYFDFYNNQKYYRILDNGKLVVSHAGIKESMIGISNENKRLISFCLYGDTTGKFRSDGRPIRRNWAQEYRGKQVIVYGHTPVKEAVFFNNTIDIDQGCVFGGKLTALRYPEFEIVQVNSSMPYIEGRIYNKL